MNSMRFWSFPVAVLIGWVVISGYTLSALSGLPLGKRTAPLESSASQSTRQNARS